MGREPDIISEIRKERLRCLGHVERVLEERTAKKVFLRISQKEKRAVGKPRKRWLDDVENYLKKMSVDGWRKIARDSDVWKLILNEAEVLYVT